MKKTAIRLADGRELIYFDERDDAAHPQPDRRPLPPPPPASHLRYDPLVDEWVAIAAHRQTRTHLPPSDQCPLCPSGPGRATEIPGHDYDVVVFENRFPAFRHLAGTPPDVASGQPATGGTTVAAGSTMEAGGAAVAGGSITPLTAVRPGAGRCEVVCFTPEHDGSFAGLPEHRVRTVLAALADRTADLSALPEVEQVFCFENRGREIGVTLPHPHGQIYGYPFLPPRTRAMLAAARRHADRTGRLLFADVLRAEREAGTRVVASNADWTAYVPAAARWPVEVHVVPHRHVLDLAGLTDAEVASFAPLYLDLLRRADALFGAPLPYIAAWHQAPTRHPDRRLAWLHLQLTSIRRAPGKLKYLAGSESAMGVFVNDVRPEDTAGMLREAVA